MLLEQAIHNFKAGTRIHCQCKWSKATTRLLSIMLSAAASALREVGVEFIDQELDSKQRNMLMIAQDGMHRKVTIRIPATTAITCMAPSENEPRALGKRSC
jgi:hypothetical protein